MAAVEEFAGTKLLDPQRFPSLHAWACNFLEVPIIKDNLAPQDKLVGRMKEYREIYLAKWGERIPTAKIKAETFPSSTHIKFAAMGHQHKDWLPSSRGPIASGFAAFSSPPKIKLPIKLRMKSKIGS
ncbi:hypothetical protein EJ110_NYTH59661 [Nymphaea thermarum]|nr:hypothetical protein EJ110_NYTH59661 [Nymphaea thermarum]